MITKIFLCASMLIMVSVVACDASVYTSEGDEHYKQGLDLQRERRFEEAIVKYDEAIRLDPSYAEAYGNRGSAYYDLGKFDQAIQNQDSAIRLDPQDAIAYYNRANAYGSLNQHRRAIQDLDSAIRLDSEFAGAMLNRGLEYANTSVGEFQRAIKDFDDVIRLEGQSLTAARAYGGRAVALAHLGMDDQSQQDVDRSVQMGIDRGFLEAMIDAITNVR